MNKKTNVYQLYISKTKISINKVSLKFKNMIKESAYTGYQYHNDNYIFSTDRKLLKEIAKSKKHEWIVELEEELEKIKSL